MTASIGTSRRSLGKPRSKSFHGSAGRIGADRGDATGGLPQSEHDEALADAIEAIEGELGVERGGRKAARRDYVVRGWAGEREMPMSFKYRKTKTWSLRAGLSLIE
jgi:hypothetical protein